MKIRLSFKTPDVMDVLNDEEMSTSEYNKAKKAIRKWVVDDEYIYVDVDTETQECIPVPAGR